MLLFAVNRLIEEAKKQEVNENAHEYDSVIFKHWAEIRKQAICEGLFGENNSQRELFNKLKRLLNPNNNDANELLEPNDDNPFTKIINQELYRRFVKDNICDGYKDEYLEHHVLVNPLEFWLVFHQYALYCKEKCENFASFDDIVLQALDPSSRGEQHYPSHGGFIANFFGVIIQNCIMNNINSEQIEERKDIRAIEKEIARLRENAQSSFFSIGNNSKAQKIETALMAALKNNVGDVRNDAGVRAALAHHRICSFFGIKKARSLSNVEGSSANSTNQVKNS